MSTIAKTFDDYSAITLNAYFHFKAACLQVDMIASDRKTFSNQDFIKQVLKARKGARIMITGIEKAYLDAGIDITQIEKENEVIFNVMEVMEKLTDKLDIKPIVRVKM